MLKYCFKIGPAKTCEAMKLARRTLMDNQVFELEAICMVLILIMVGPFMLLFRSYLWGSMSHAEQIATGGSPERSLFVVWPYFIGFVVGVPSLAMPLWYPWYHVFSSERVKNWNCSLVIISGLIIGLHSIGLLLWNMKLDNSVLVNQNLSGLTCSMPIIIGLALCTIYSCIYSMCINNDIDLVGALWFGLWSFIIVVSPPLTLLILLIRHFDYGLEVQFWVYPVVLFGLWSCCGCLSICTIIMDYYFQ